MQIGIDSFAAAISDPATGLTLSPVERMQHLLAEIELADEVGLDVFGIGEHHRAEFLDSAPALILAAAATRTKNIRLTSAVTVLSAADPVRVFQEFATLDLISGGRAEVVARRAIGGRVERFDEIHVAIGTVREAEAIFRFAFWAEHKNKEEGRCRAPLKNSPLFKFRDASVRDASRRRHLIADCRR